MPTGVPKASANDSPVIERVSSRTIPGPLVAANKGAVDWGWQSFLAYGCCNQVVVVDTKYLRVYQTLGKHTSPVVKVKWAKETHYHDTDRPFSLLLASADASGRIVVWDVVNARQKCAFHDENKPVVDMEWAFGNDSTYNLIVVLHQPNILSVCNTDNGTCVWKKHLQGDLQCFTIDPFNSSNISFLSNECILVLDDFNTAKKPSSNGRKFYISNHSTNATGQPPNKVTHTEDKHNTRGMLRRRMRFLIRADHKNNPEVSTSLNECVQIIYHQTRRHHLLLVFPREVLILDLAINQTVGIITPDRNGSSFAQVFSCWQRDVLFCCHESGSISMRIKAPECQDYALPYVNSITSHPSESCWDVTYNLQCQSDTLRLTRHVYVAGMAMCPITESKLALLLNDGRVLIQELHQISKDGPSLKLILTGSLSCVSSPPHIIRMCPPVTFRNWPVYDPLIAVGCTNGSVQIFSVATGVMEKEISIHTAPVRGIEWVSLKSFLSYAYPNLSSSNGLVRNELILTDIMRGHSIPLRADREDESAIEMVRVSYLRHYVIVAFKEEPFELWDLHNLSLLRMMPKNFPTITALEWSPLHSRRHSVNGPQQTTLQNEKKDESSNENLQSATTTPSSESLPEPKPVKEHFVFTDTDGQLYHFSVEGSMVRDNSRIPPDSGMGSITCIAWKSDQVVLGDVDGNLNLWDLKAKKSRGIQTHRGWIKKIRFSPGRGNLRILVLYNDGVDLWDIKEVQLISQVKCPKDYPKVLDIDWASSDRPILAVIDGSIHITDINLRINTSPLQDYQPTDQPWCPSVLSPKAALNLKTIFEHRMCQMQDVISLSKDDGISEDDIQILLQQSDSLQEYLSEVLEASDDTVKNCAQVARLFGDEEACHFWTVAAHAFRKHASTKSSTDEDTENNQDSDLSEGNYDLFCDNQVYRKLQLGRTALHESKRTSYAHTKNCAETLILLGETDKAVQLLLETDADNDSYYTDCLKACLITSVRSSSASQSVIKLVATNLIAGGHIQEGVELLCLIDKSLDACRYLQSSGNWEKAAWLAKSTLNDEECTEVMKRWADHLCSAQVNQRSKALLLMLSMRDFHRVLIMLHSFGMTQRAALFLQACIEKNIIEQTQDMKPFMNTVFTDYAHFLTSLGNYKCALHICGQVGDVPDARELKEKLLILTQES